jgi:hypothetical protein
MKARRPQFGARLAVASGVLLTYIPLTLAVAQIADGLLPDSWQRGVARLAVAFLVSALVVGLSVSLALLAPSRAAILVAVFSLAAGAIATLALSRSWSYTWEPMEVWIAGTSSFGVLLGAGGLIAWSRPRLGRPVA